MPEQEDIIPAGEAERTLRNQDPGEIHQAVSDVRYAATSATGRATIQITNYYYAASEQAAGGRGSVAGAGAPDDLPCPYRDLFHFGPDDAALFFGRDAVVERLHQAIQTRAFLPLLGASGSGKSSVVLAGLVPRLQREGHWRFTHFRPGEGTEDTRRVATRQELGAATWELVKQLADARLVVTNRGEDAAVETVEVVHEALDPPLGRTARLDRQRPGVPTWQERLRASLGQWQATRRDEGLLLRGAALAEAREQLKQRGDDLSAPEREFIEASAAAIERARRQERRRRRVAFGGLAVVTVALLLAWGQLMRAQRHRQAHGGQPPRRCAAGGPCRRRDQPLWPASASRFPPASSDHRSADRRMGAHPGAVGAGARRECRQPVQAVLVRPSPRPGGTGGFLA